MNQAEYSQEAQDLIEEAERQYIGVPNHNFTMRAMKMLERDINLFAWRYTIPGYDVEDVKQELRWQLYRKFDRYNPQKSALRTWAWTVMRNRLTDMSRCRSDYLDQPIRFPYLDEEEFELVFSIHMETEVIF